MQKDCPKAPNLLFLYKYLPDGETWAALTTFYLILPEHTCSPMPESGEGRSVEGKVE